jgi:hypothetical protein
MPVQSAPLIQEQLTDQKGAVVLRDLESFSGAVMVSVSTQITRVVVSSLSGNEPLIRLSLVVIQTKSTSLLTRSADEVYSG